MLARWRKFPSWLSGLRGRRVAAPSPGTEPVVSAVQESPGPAPLGADDLERAAEILKRFSTAPGPWDEFRDRHFALPDWYLPGLDPHSPAYAQQQDRLWEWMSGRRGYRAAEQEQTPEVGDLDPVYQPAFYMLRMPGAVELAGKHLISTGHFLRRSGIEACDRVLEYGAGYGQTALAFARMGALVDTVDVNPHFCRAVQAQAEFFRVPLTAFAGEFGDNPRPGEKYRLIFFYEAFHHCRDFIRVIGRLREHLASDGKILLGGEPITPDEGSAAIPFPWGLRLDAENAGVVRWRGWYELGFQEDFLVRCFIRQGYRWRKHPCEISEFATLHEFRLRGDVIDLAGEQFAPSDAGGWHGPEPSGRWTNGCATLSLDCRDPQATLTVTASNYHHRSVAVWFVLAGAVVERRFQPGETLEVALSPRGADRLEIRSEPIRPTEYGVPDQRPLGIFVQQLLYSGGALPSTAVPC